MKREEGQAGRNEGQPNRSEGQVKPQVNHRNQQFQSSHRDGQHAKGYHKGGGWSRPSYQSSMPRYNNKIRAEETIDDIKEDIVRLEKEIDLELKEIKSLKLGL